MTFPAPAPAPKKRRPLRWIVGALAVFVVIGIVNGGDDAETASVTGAADAKPPVVRVEQDPAPEVDAPSEPARSAPAAFPGATADDVVVPGGETATLDSGVSVTATALSAGRDAFGTASLCSSVEIVNGSDSQLTFNAYEWKLQDPQGAAMATNFGGTDTFLGSGELAPGGRVSGDLCFDDQSGADGTFVLLYEPLSLFSTERAAWLTAR